MKTKDIPLNMPCSDPEGCKHFKDVMKAIERIKELEDEAERLRWISVNEKLPEEDTYFVLYDDGEQRFIYEADFIDKKWYSMTGHVISFITHYKSIILPEQALKVGLTKGKVKKVGPRTPRSDVKPIGQKPAKHVLKRPVVYNDRVVGPS